MDNKDIKKYCEKCYWHCYHGCHIDIVGKEKCINTLVLNQLNKKDEGSNTYELGFLQYKNSKENEKRSSL